MSVAEVVLVDLAGRVVERARVRSGVRAAFRLERRQLVEAEELAQRRRLSVHRGELRALRLVLGEREHRLGVPEDVRALLRGARRIDPDDDRADRHHRPVEQHPLEPGARDHRDGVAAADAAGEQPVRERLDALAGLLPGDLAPAVPCSSRYAGAVTPWSST